MSIYLEEMPANEMDASSSLWVGLGLWVSGCDPPFEGVPCYLQLTSGNASCISMQVRLKNYGGTKPLVYSIYDLNTRERRREQRDPGGNQTNPNEQARHTKREREKRKNTIFFLREKSEFLSKTSQKNKIDRELANWFIRKKNQHNSISFFYFF